MYGATLPLNAPLTSNSQTLQVLGTEQSVVDYPIQDEALNADLSPLDPLVSTFSTSTEISTLWGKDAPIMTRILECESSMREWGPDGKVLLSKTADKGIGQVNQIWWNKADELEFDLDTTLGNLMMAHYVWEESGFEAWTCSHLVP